MLSLGDKGNGTTHFGTFRIRTTNASMRILLDECVPWPMHKLLVGHECTTAQMCGWGGIKNGELLSRAEGGFELFITSDQNIRYQQNLAGFRIAIVELSTNDLRRLEAAGQLLRAAIQAIQIGEIQRLEVP